MHEQPLISPAMDDIMTSPPPPLAELPRLSASEDEESASHTGKGPQWSVGPLPDWIDRPSHGLPCDGLAAVVLLDDQHNFADPRQPHFMRVIYRVRHEQDVTAFKLMRFQLAHDRTEVVVHALNVYRGREVRSHLHPWFTTTTPCQFVAKEAEVGPPHVVKGEPAALLHRIVDLQIGDYVEVAHTYIQPVDPAIAGLISGTATLVRDELVQRLRLRLLFPNRRVAIHMVGVDGQPTQRRHETYTEFVWSSRDVPALPRALADQKRRKSRPHIQYSELPDWDAVARLMSPYYECDDPPPEIAEIAAGIARAHPTKRAQVLAVMRYVQDGFAFEAYDTREQLLRPKPLARVLAERATDCKGKTGRSQDSCRLNVYAVCFAGSETTGSRSGLRVTIRIGSQLRVARDHRSGCLPLARA